MTELRVVFIHCIAGHGDVYTCSPPESSNTPLVLTARDIRDLLDGTTPILEPDTPVSSQFPAIDIPTLGEECWDGHNYLLFLTCLCPFWQIYH